MSVSATHSSELFGVISDLCLEVLSAYVLFHIHPGIISTPAQNGAAPGAPGVAWLLPERSSHSVSNQSQAKAAVSMVSECILDSFRDTACVIATCGMAVAVSQLCVPSSVRAADCLGVDNVAGHVVSRSPRMEFVVAIS